MVRLGDAEAPRTLVDGAKNGLKDGIAASLVDKLQQQLQRLRIQAQTSAAGFLLH